MIIIIIIISHLLSIEILLISNSPMLRVVNRR